MAYVPLEDLMKRADSVYKLVILAARRATELNGGAPKLVESDSKRTSTIALEEVAQGKVGYKLSKKK